MIDKNKLLKRIKLKGSLSFIALIQLIDQDKAKPKSRMTQHIKSRNWFLNKLPERIGFSNCAGVSTCIIKIDETMISRTALSRYSTQNSLVEFD